MADKRIQYNELMTGAGHPTKEDSLNRLTLVEHNADGTHDSTKVAPASKGVTSGDAHNHTGGAGAQLDHTNLLNKGTNTHTQIDSALSRLTNTSGTNTGDQDLSGFATTSSVTAGLATKQATLVSGTNIKTVNGTTILGSGNITISSGVTDHTALTNIGTHTHSQIDSHITNTNNPHNATAAQLGFANKLTLDKIGEALGEPTWNGGPWPGEGGGGGTSGYVDAGVIVAPSYVDNADGSVTIGSGEYVLYLSTGTFPPQRYAVAGGTFTLTDNAVNYIKVSYNAGTPAMSCSTSRTDINQLDVIPVHTLYRSGTTIIVLTWNLAAIGLANKLNDRMVRTKRFEVEPNGLALGENTGRVLTMTSGFVWSGHDRITMAAYRSDVDTMKLYYKVSGVWNSSLVTSYNNTQYDDGNNLQVLTAGRYAVNWVVRRVAEPGECVCIIMGGGDYTLAQAQTSTVPVIPNEVASLGVLVGRIIVLKNASTATQIDSVLTTPIGTTSVADHAQLGNLQGGTTGEHYHLTSAELTKLGGIADGAEVNVNADWNAVSGDAQILNKPATYAPSAHTTSSHSDWPAGVDMTEVGYLNGVTSAIQTQIGNKQDTLVSGTNIKTVNGQSLVGSGGITVTGGMSASLITGNTTAVKDTRYLCDTSSAGFTLTLPAAPTAGDYIEVVDDKGTWATNNLTVARNSLKINGLSEDLVLNVSNTFITFTYADVSRGWQVDIGGAALVSTPADKSVTPSKFADASLQMQADLTNLLYPSSDGAYRDLARSGWLHAGMNQQWGGGQWGCEMVDGATGNLYKFDVATGNIEDNNGTSFSLGNAASVYYEAQGFTTSESMTLDAVWLKLYKAGNPTGSLTIRIYTNNAGLPNTAIGSAATISCKLLTSKTDGEWYRISGLAASLTAGNTYHVGMTLSVVDASNYLQLKNSRTKKYPFGNISIATSTPVWSSSSSDALCFLIENPASTKLLTTGGQFDGKLQFGADTYPSQIKALTQPMRNFFDGKEFTYTVRGTAFTKDKTVADFAYGLDHDRIVLRCNATTGYAQLDVYDQSGTKRTVTGTTDVSTGFHDVAIHVRSKADGADKIELFVDGASQGTPLTGLTLTFDPLMRDLGTAWVGGGFALAPTWTQKLDMTTLPSANGWTWTGTGTEANCMSVSGGKLYQNKNGYGSTDTGYYAKSSLGLSNATGWCVAWKGRVLNDAGGASTLAPITINVADGAKSIQLRIREYFCVEYYSNATIQLDCKTQDIVFVLCGKGSDYYLFANDKLVIDGTGLFTNVNAGNAISFGDIDNVASSNADAIWDYVAYYTGGMMIPQATSGTLSEAAYWSGDKTSYLPTLYNSGTPISVKQFTGMNRNYVDEVVQKEVRGGVTSSPTTTSISWVTEPDMECYVVGSLLSAKSFDYIISSVASSQYASTIFVDGSAINICASYPPATSQVFNVSSVRESNVQCGLHKVETKWQAGAGTLSGWSINRNLTVEAKS